MTEPLLNFYANYVAMCVNAPNILASIVHHATAKGENCFPCLVYNLFTASTAGFATSPSLSLSLCGGRISNTMRKPTPGYVDVFQSSESTRRQNLFRSLLASRDLDFLWKEHFRVTRETFEYLCDLVRVNLRKQHTRFRSPVSVEERVGLALRRLATGNSYRSCGLQFGLEKSTSKSVCSEFEQAIFNLKDRFIKFPL